jgi:hypothetical protein
MSRNLKEVSAKSYISTDAYNQNFFTYSVTTGLSLQSLNTSQLQLSLRASASGSSAYFNLAYGASQAVFNVITQDIDSTNGQTICAFLYSPTSSNTKNWLNLQSYRIQNTQIYLN